MKDDQQPQPAASPAATARAVPGRKHRARRKPGQRAEKPAQKAKKPHYTQRVGHTGNQVNSKYKGEIYPKQAQELAMYGLTDKELSVFFKISERTFSSWCKKYKLFAEAVENGRLPANAKSVAALFRAGTGYRYTEEEYRVNPKTKEQVLVKVQTKEQTPNVAAIMAFLKNRSDGRWSDKQSVEHTGAGGEPLQPIIIRITAEELPQAKQPIIDLPPQPQLRAPQPEPPQEAAPATKEAQAQPQQQEQATAGGISISVTPEELPVARQPETAWSMDELAAAVDGLKQ